MSWPRSDLRWIGVWIGVGLLVVLAAVAAFNKLRLFGLWLGFTHVVGVLAYMAGTPFWFWLERVFGPGFLAHGYPFWVCMAVWLSVALLLSAGWALAGWRLGWATIAMMSLWAYLIFSIGLATAPRGRYLPPMPWLG